MFNKFMISKENLFNNLKQVKKNNPNSKICAMVKADAYGVGMCEIVKLLDNKVDYFGVACFFEAVEVRKLTDLPILIISPIGEIDFELCEKFNIEISINGIDDIKRIIKSNNKVGLHIKINSGMNRYGVKNESEYERMLKLIKKKNLPLKGLFTHFATKDDYVETQMKSFEEYLRIAKNFGLNPILHTDNSIVNLTSNHHLDIVRIGFNLYNKDENGFSPVVKIKSVIAHENFVHKGELIGYDKKYIADKNLRIGVVPVGYADGFLQGLKGFEIYNDGEFLSVLNICMDCFMLDISNTKLKVGDNIDILNHSNSLSRYAKYLNTNEYEIMTNFSKIRADRVIE